MHLKNHRILFAVCLFFLLLLAVPTNATAGINKFGPSQYRGRTFMQFSIGPAVTLYSRHRTVVDDNSNLEDDDKKWWRFLGIERNYGLSLAYVSRGGFIIGGEISAIRGRGMKKLNDKTSTTAPENPRRTFSIVSGPTIGFYPHPKHGWFVQFTPALGFSTFSINAPTGSLRAVTGYDWPAGPSGTFGMSLGFQFLWTKSEEEGIRPTLKYDSVHLPVVGMFNICLKGFMGNR